MDKFLSEGSQITASLKDERVFLAECALFLMLR